MTDMKQLNKVFCCCRKEETDGAEFTHLAVFQLDYMQSVISVSTKELVVTSDSVKNFNRWRRWSGLLALQERYTLFELYSSP